MKPNTQDVKQIQSYFRDVIRDRANEKEQPQSVVLGLENKDWSMVCTALDVIVDTNLAIEHFLKTGIEINDKTNEGEKYLRLYGLLNSTYLQQQAIIVIYGKLTFCNKVVKKLIESLEIRKIRNKIGSHSSDYKHGKESYIVIRHTLSKYTFIFENNEVKKDGAVEQEFVNLNDLLDEHLKLVVDLLCQLCEVIIKILYKDKHKQEEELKKLLSLCNNAIL